MGDAPAPVTDAAIRGYEGCCRSGERLILPDGISVARGGVINSAFFRNYPHSGDLPPTRLPYGRSIGDATWDTITGWKASFSPGAFDFMMRRMSVALSRARGRNVDAGRRHVGSFVLYYPSQFVALAHDA